MTSNSSRALMLAIPALAGAAAIAPDAGLAASAQELQDAHIARIEAGLLPAVQVRGRTLAPHTLADEMATHHTPSVSIAVVDHGRIVWARAYGQADVASGRAATTRTLYQAASISKTVTASAAMQMVQEGRLGLDRPVNAQLKSWRIPDNSFTRDHPVTVREVMTHTGGLTVSGFGGYAPDAPLPSTVQILEGGPPANTPAVLVDQAPGATYRYSGGGYIVLQQLMTDVDGRGFPALMQDRVLSRVGMTASGYDQPLPAARRGEAAMAYRSDGKPVEGGFHVYPELAAAGLWTTPSDLARWAMALERADNGEPSALMSQASARAMLTPGLASWGLGIVIVSPANGLFGFGGSNLGFKSELFGWPQGERAIVVMANGEDSMTVVGAVARAVAREYGWKGLEPKIIDAAPLSAAQRSQFVGSWGHGGLVVTADGDRLFGKAFGRSFELVPQDADRLVVAEDVPLVIVTAARAQDGRITALKVGSEASLDRDP
jgi:CubicO group peptidase (beta-lactamase class C family)